MGLVYSTRTTQYHTVTHDGRESECLRVQITVYIKRIRVPTHAYKQQILRESECLHVHITSVY